MLNENIKKLRMLRSLSQVELAKGLHVSKQCISNWENDNILPSVEMLVKIANFFDVSTDCLLGLQSKKTISADGLTDEQTEHIKILIDDLRKANGYPRQSEQPREPELCGCAGHSN